MSQATLPQRPYTNSNLFSSHYLDERLQEREEWDCDENAREALDELRSLHDLEGGLVEGYGEDALIDNWIAEVLEILGFGTQKEVTLPGGGGFVDELLFESPTARREAAEIYLDTEDTTDLYERGIGVVEAKQWDANFDVRFSEQRPYRNASHQIKHYLERSTENIQWGLLTNGRKWRLYGTNDYETQTYYEIDLPEILQRGDLDAFKYFYVLFRPQAFRESDGTTFLDEVWSESETASQELGEDLQNNVFTALRVLGHGFVESNDNLEIDSGEEEALDELKEQSLVLLYRLMFVLYAEARGLIHPEGQSAQDEYEENFSLNELRLDIHGTIGEVDEGFDDEFSEYSTTMWSRLEDLFRLIDEGEESLGIPPYNGGLFDHEDHDFLTEHKLSNRHLAEVIYRLSTTQNGDDRYVLADYADLDTRHLGSVYEGLLEHQFRIAPEEYVAVPENGGQVWKPAAEVTVDDTVETVPEGGLYVVNDEGERKATGAYYTPDYVVTYIVEETVGPLIEEIREDLVEQGFETGTHEYLGPFLRRITNLRILDPAMGSGHFLTKTTGYLSEQVMANVRDVETELGVAFDEQHVRREIAKECIYGVDLNGMAVELAKLSMWLETLAADRPLAFLDHHFKQGNSLVGSDIESIEELESDASGGDDQASLAEFGATREGTIERLMEIYREFLAIENETVEDVREMKRKYAEIEQYELRRRLVAMANVHTAERFGLDVPGGAYERMAKALEDDVEWKNIENIDWFSTAQLMAEEQDFFHWKLAFPEVFYRHDGSLKDRAGFDAVAGNPPYVNSKHLPTDQKEYLENTYTATTGRWDVYMTFTELGIEVSSRFVTYIQPTMFFRRPYGEGLRECISENTFISNIVDLSELNVFEDATNYVCIFQLDKRFEDNDFQIQTPDNLRQFWNRKSGNSYQLSNSELSSDPWNVIPGQVMAIIQKVPDDYRNISGVTKSITEGIHTGKDEVFIMSQEKSSKLDLESDLMKPMLEADDIKRYKPLSTEMRVLYPYKNNSRISTKKLKKSYPNIWSYLKSNEDKLKSRTYLMDSGYEWYELWRKRESEIYENPKIMTPEITNRSNFTIDEGKPEHYFNTRSKSIRIKENVQISIRTLVGLLNSKLLQFIYRGIAPPKRGGYREYKTGFMSELQVPDKDHQEINELVDVMFDLNSELDSLNLSLLDYIRPFSDGPLLTDIGTYQPSEDVGKTILTATKDDYENIRVGAVTCERESESTVVINVTTRYKPEDEDAHETDQWGYTETEQMPAMRLTDLSEVEADLVEAFVPVAVEKADGFAGFRETATKTNSLVDRLEKITLPNPDDVTDDLERYREAVERAEELDEKIQHTDEMIDELVYELYGLTDEEIEIVEEAVTNN